MNTSMIFSLGHVSDSVLMESLDILSQSNFEKFEISGSHFENAVYRKLRHSFFESGKKITSISELLSSSLSRNWSSSPDNIKEDLQELLDQTILNVGEDNIKFVELDFALDFIKSGFEVGEINQRSALLCQSMKAAEKAGVVINLSLRFPKVFPKSADWRLLTMLVNNVFHKNTSVTVNLFPFETKPAKISDLLKRVFFLPSVIRLNYDPATDGDLNRDTLQEWIQVLCDQGYSGELILAPKIKSEKALIDVLKKSSALLKPYEFS